MNDQRSIEGNDGELERVSRTRNGRAVAWILAAFGFLLAALAGGAALQAARSDLAWTVPLAGFAAYLFAFHRGMVLWNPGIDRTWRRQLGGSPPAASGRDGWDSEATVPLLPSDAGEPPRAPLRVVR